MSYTEIQNITPPPVLKKARWHTQMFAQLQGPWRCVPFIPPSIKCEETAWVHPVFSVHSVRPHSNLGVCQPQSPCTEGQDHT